MFELSNIELRMKLHIMSDDLILTGICDLRTIERVKIKLIDK